MIESFSDFLKRSNVGHIFENNEPLVRREDVPTESIRTGGSLDKEFWDEYFTEDDPNFVKPKFVSDSRFFTKAASVVINNLKKNFDVEWVVWPYIVNVEGSDGVMIYNNDESTYLILVKTGIDKKIILFKENPIEKPQKSNFTVSTTKFGFLKMIRNLVNMIGVLNDKTTIISEAKEVDDDKKEVEEEPFRGYKARAYKEIIMPGEVKVRTDGSVKGVVAAFMGSLKGSKRDETEELNRNDVNEYLKLFEIYDDPTISRIMTTELYDEDSGSLEGIDLTKLRTVQMGLYMKGGKFDSTNAGRYTGMVHCILCGYDDCFNTGERKMMRECWFWEAGKSGRLATYFDPRDRIYKVKEMASKVELEVKKLDRRLEREKQFVSAMLNYVKEGGKNGTDTDLRGLMSNHRGLMVTGMGGVGKTVAYNQAIAETGARENIDYIKLNTVGTAQSVYKTLYKYNDMVIIYDDTKSLWEDDDKVALFKQATSNTEDSRTIDTPSAKGITAGSSASPFGSEYYNVIGGKVDRHQRYYLEVGSISEYDRKIWIEKKIGEIKRNEDAAEARYLRSLTGKDKEEAKLYGSPFIRKTDEVIMGEAERAFEEYAEARQQEHFPNRFTFNGFIVFITNETISSFINSRIVGPHWGGLSRRLSIIDISPRPNVVWEWLKRKINNDIENEDLPDNCRILPKVGKAENSTIENIMSFLDDVMNGKYDTDTERYGKISFATIGSLKDYISSSRNTEEEWKELILDDMLMDSEREQS